MRSIRGRRTFEALRRQGVRVRVGPLGITHLPGAAGDGPSLAFALPRRLGGAVVRNRLRRRLRAILEELERTEPGTVPAGATVVTATESAIERTHHELEDDVKHLLSALQRRLDGRGGR